MASSVLGPKTGGKYILLLNKCRLNLNVLRKLQAPTLPDATPPIVKIYPFKKMAANFEPVCDLDLDLERF